MWLGHWGVTPGFCRFFCKCINVLSNAPGSVRPHGEIGSAHAFLFNAEQNTYKNARVQRDSGGRRAHSKQVCGCNRRCLPVRMGGRVGMIENTKSRSGGLGWSPACRADRQSGRQKQKDSQRAKQISKLRKRYATNIQQAGRLAGRQASYNQRTDT